MVLEDSQTWESDVPKDHTVVLQASQIWDHDNPATSLTCNTTHLDINESNSSSDPADLECKNFCIDQIQVSVHVYYL